MKRFSIALALLATFALAGGVQAQDAATDAATDADVREELRTLITDDAAADRAALEDFLQREDVQRTAAGNGLDVERAMEGLGTLGPEQVSRVAALLESDGELAGGDTVVITSTTIIIILLILLLIEI